MIALTAPTSLINLTGHDIVLTQPGGTVTIEPSGLLARVETFSDHVRTIEVAGDRPGTTLSFPVRRTTLCGVVGLPPPIAGVTYLVSRLVLEASDRTDLLAPADLLKDGQRRVLCAQSLAVR